MTDPESEEETTQGQSGPSPDLSSREVSRVYIEEEWRGPLPPPHALRLYDEVVKDGANRLLIMAESGHRHQIEQEEAEIALERAALESANQIIANDASRSKMGLIFAFVIALVGMGIAGWLTSIGKGGFGLVFVFAPLISLVGAFIYGASRRRANLRSRFEDDRND